MNFTSFSPLSAPGLVTQSALPPAENFRSRDLKPPRGLYIPSGPISNAEFFDRAPPKGGRTVVQRLGLAYEQKVIDVLSAIYAENFTSGVPILFEDRRGLHRCIPDGLLRLGDKLVIIEVKLRHTERAWWQLKKLYEPVLRTMVVSNVTILTCEICRSYDPDESFGPHEVTRSFHKLSESRVGVIQWSL